MFMKGYFTLFFIRSRCYAPFSRPDLFWGGLQGMTEALRRRIWYIWCKSAVPLLAFFWCVGLPLGMRTALRSDGLIAVFQCAVQVVPSPVGLLTASVAPFLLCGFAVYLSEPWLLLIISGVKAFNFGYCACGTILAFGQGSWLVRFLFLFSDCCLIPLLLLYCVRHIRSRTADWELRACLIIAVLIAFFDYWVISPFLVSISG